MRITTSDIVRSINDLPRDRAYRYINPRTTTNILIDSITLPEGPITIKRYDPSRRGSPNNAIEVSLSTQMISRIANSLLPGQPINVDRVLGASYNTRSALETLLAHTPQFYVSYPGRLDSYSGEVVRGHKHLIWNPGNPHDPGQIVQIQTDIVISELPIDVTYESLAVPDEMLLDGIDIEIQRSHARIQVALLITGIKLGYSVWIARNDRNIIYNNTRIGDFEGVIESLHNEGTLISSIPDAPEAASFIDCIWFANHRYMPVVMEIEHTTGVTSGLNRMLGLRNQIPAVRTRYVVVAPDEDRHHVIREINREQFSSLNAGYFPYSSVLELFSLCNRRNIKGVNQDFIDSFVEKAE